MRCLVPQVGPPSGLLKGKQPAEWRSKDVANTVLIDRQAFKNFAMCMFEKIVSDAVIAVPHSEEISLNNSCGSLLVHKSSLCSLGKLSPSRSYCATQICDWIR